MNKSTASLTTGHLEGVRMGILRAFLAADNFQLSGSVLSTQFEVSRTAIWKHIQALESMGFRFESTHASGYRLTEIPDRVIGPLIEPLLQPGNTFGRTVEFFHSVASTNALAADLAVAGADHGTLVTAAQQNGGRGRRGKPWFSPEGGLWMSLILKKPLPLARAAELTLMTSVAVRRSLHALTHIPIDIKWPNDLLTQGRKLCGILAEIRADGEQVSRAILGIGINTNIPTDAFPVELRSTATSILAESGQSVSNVALAAAILAELEPLYDGLAQGTTGFADLSDEWRSGCVTLGNFIRVQTPTILIEGTATRVDDSGVLYLQPHEGSEVAIHTGEVLM